MKETPQKETSVCGSEKLGGRSSRSGGRRRSHKQSVKVIGLGYLIRELQ